MKNFEKQNFQKENLNPSFLIKRKIFSGNVSIRLLKYDFFEKSLHKQNFPMKKSELFIGVADQAPQISSFDQNSKFTPNLMKKKLLNGYSKIHELKLVTIELASPEKIKAWAEKELPNGKIFGEVTNANTFHYRTFKPSKGGLFCERIFGPLKDFECACGKRQRPSALESRKILEHQQTSRYFCPNCDVEYTWSIIRRYQLGYIKLNAPVTHLWYFKTNPSYLSILFDIKRKHLESIIYCTETITIENTWKYSQQTSILNPSPKDLYLTWQKFFTLEDQLQKYKRIYQNKHEQQKQKKIVFRNFSITQNKICQQINWKNFGQQTVEKNRKNSLFSPNFQNIENIEALGSKTKSHIFQNISMQKQKKFVTCLFEEIWKRFVQKSYKNAFVFLNSQESFSEHFFQNMYRVSNIFLFSSKKTQKFLNFGQVFIFGHTESLKKTILKLKNQQKSLNSLPSDLTTQFLEQKSLKAEDALKTKKQYWKSFFFLLEFARFFLHQKNTKIKNFNSISKKDFLFLVNIIPFLKGIFLFQNLQFLKKTSKKIHSLLIQNLSKKNNSSKKRKFFKKSLLNEKSFLKLQNQCEENKVFLFESNFSPFQLFFQKTVENGTHKLLEPMCPVQYAARVKFKKTLFFSENTNFSHKISSIFSFRDFYEGNQTPRSSIFNQLFYMSLNFGKILSFLKSYYEIDFCSLVQKNSFDFENNFTRVAQKKNLSKNEFEIISAKSSEVFFNQSKLFSMYENVFFDSFSFFFHFLKFYQFSIFNMNFSICSKFYARCTCNSQKTKSFYSQNFRVQEALFFSLKYMPFLFFVSEHEQKQISTENTLENSRFEILPEQNSFLITQKQKSKRQFEIFISNKPLLSRITFHQRKKQIQNEKVQKFFDFDSVAEDFELKLYFKKKSKLFSQKVSTSLLQLTQVQKKSKEPFLYKIIKPKNQKKKRSKNFNVFLSAKSKAKQPTQEKHQKTERSHFLQNSILTIAYNYPWNNDADWKYFVYYNSLFFYEFEDSAIFLYRSLSPIKGAKNNQAFMLSEANSMSPKFGESFSSFLSWSIDDLPKNFFVGAGILKKLLTEYTSSELRKMTKQHQILLPKINQMLRFLKQNAKTKKDSVRSARKIQKYFHKREQIIRRLKFLRKFSRRNSNPTFMILKNLPVLPPDLRPILKLQNQIAASDLNRFYQRIIYRNDRLKKFAKDSATNQSFEIKYAQRLLQEAVDNLIQNGKGNVKAETNSRGQPLKSLSEILKGKQGRFRQYLLGKRVDYSGRSVIVVGPELKLYECGLPKEMALELFLPFLIQYILQNKLAQTVVGAKNLLKSDSNLTLHLLHKVIKNIPILLNRAPTLHRLGFQAFLPKLIEGRAILLHPMVCPAFNADFDGDQMAVHIPLTVEARTEAWKFMLATNNLMNSATGEAIILPSQDMVLGCYYLTLDFQSKFGGVQLSNFVRSAHKKQNALFGSSEPNRKPEEKNFQVHFQDFQKFIIQNKAFLLFTNFLSVINAYQRQEISLHTPVWVKWNSNVDFGNELSKPVELRLQMNGSWEEIQPKYTNFYNYKNKQLHKVIRTMPGRILMNFMIQECSIA
uniref:beta' subunit of RNA polymerase n=1 Tax=Tetradesmus dimorphus TaxID=119574 RepID=UPI0030012910|nr:beta' subunit of RNA polymerase [Tetradesmus dimorphus]